MSGRPSPQHRSRPSSRRSWRKGTSSTPPHGERRRQGPGGAEWLGEEVFFELYDEDTAGWRPAPLPEVAGQKGKMHGELATTVRSSRRRRAWWSAPMIVLLTLQPSSGLWGRRRSWRKSRCRRPSTKFLQYVIGIQERGEYGSALPNTLCRSAWWGRLSIFLAQVHAVRRRSQLGTTDSLVQIIAPGVSACASSKGSGVDEGAPTAMAALSRAHGISSIMKRRTGSWCWRRTSMSKG